MFAPNRYSPYKYKDFLIGIALERKYFFTGKNRIPEGLLLIHTSDSDIPSIEPNYRYNHAALAVDKQFL
jgi:hypothetical protein